MGSNLEFFARTHEQNCSALRPMTNLSQYSRCNMDVSSSIRAEFQIDVEPKEQGRREYATDNAYLTEEPSCIVARIRKDRLIKGLSAPALARKANTTIRVVKYHEERMTPDDIQDISYLKKVARALGFDEDHYLDDYLKWIDEGTFAEDVKAYINSTGKPLVQLYDLLGAKEYAVSQWRKGLSRPSRRMYELIQEQKKRD